MATDTGDSFRRRLTGRPNDKDKIFDRVVESGAARLFAADNELTILLNIINRTVPVTDDELQLHWPHLTGIIHLRNGGTTGDAILYQTVRLGLPNVLATIFERLKVHMHDKVLTWDTIGSGRPISTGNILRLLGQSTSPQHTEQSTSSSVVPTTTTTTTEASKPGAAGLVDSSASSAVVPSDPDTHTHTHTHTDHQHQQHCRHQRRGGGRPPLPPRPPAHPHIRLLQRGRHQPGGERPRMVGTRDCQRQGHHRCAALWSASAGHVKATHELLPPQG
ncbi:unnamed protein product [Vitrella brassicaformis CCMP3155]|uniref:Uncharacterized protein n=1 Tax=Vitrella brassicaformis (strain CCMP3155) TaxID=1169540 RepID=A0A0G4GI31_VITBC|nr:unnamed protein product [Vitrella brassicaformis CCMP3155]|eukprot:CEM29388.1 unnamed protein product [Vitrella brassicaformis CCMP3155]